MALAFLLIGGLSNGLVDAANYVEQGRLHDAASWRSDEFRKNWGLGAIGADHAYARGLSGAGVRVGVYDSGVDLRHGEFAGKPHSGVPLADPGCISPSLLSDGCFLSEGDRAAVNVVAAPPPDADLEGAIADGIFTREQLDEYLENVGARYNTHGTHVAGAVLANRDGSGVHGVAYAATLSTVRNFGHTYQQGLDALSETLIGPNPSTQAVDNAYAQLHRQNVRVVNNSWGVAYGPRDEAELDNALTLIPQYSNFRELLAIADATLKYGMLHVWSAGNAANDSPQTATVAGIHPSLPRAITELEPYWLAVVNVNQQLSLSNDSYRCGFSKDWCLAAPGTDIASTRVDGSIDTQNHYDADGEIYAFDVTGDHPRLDYATGSGTSFAAPHVTGGLALLMERFPYLDNRQIRDVLLTTATDLGEPGVDDVYGWGLMNLRKAIDGPGQLRVDTHVVMDRPAGGAIVWQGGAWDDWRNDISGPGRLEKSGRGWLRLSGNNSFAGATLNSGILELDGINTLNGDVNLDGGTLSLNGSLSIDGDYRQAAGATLMTGLVAEANPAKLQVQRQASLHGNLYLSAPPATYPLGQRYTLLQARGGLNGEFAEIDRREFSPFLSVSQVRQADRLLVEFGRGRPLASAAGTGNQRAVATAADAQDTSQPVLQRLASLFPDKAPAALDQLSGELHTSTQAVMLENTDLVRQTVLERLRKAPAPQNQGVWVKVPHQSGQLSGDGNTATTTHSTQGLLVGFDHSLQQGTRLGVLLGNDRSTVKAGTRGNARVETYQVGLHAGHDWDAFGLYGGVVYAQHQIQAQRRVSFPGIDNRLSTDYTSRTVQAFAEASYRFSHDAWEWQPYLQLAHVEQRSAAFKERGGITALRGKRAGNNVNLTSGGVRMNIDLGKAQIGPSWLSARGGLAYTKAYGDLQPAAHVAWDGGATLEVAGAPLDRHRARLELGATARLTHNSALDLSFNAQRGERTRATDVTASYTLRF